MSEWTILFRLSIIFLEASAMRRMPNIILDHDYNVLFSQLMCCVVLLCFKTVALWRMSQQLQHHQCLTVSTLGATSAAQTSGEKASHSHETRIRLGKLQRSEHVSVCLNHLETCARLPSQPSPYCCSPSLTGGAKMFGNRGANTDASQDNTLCGRALPHASLKLHLPSSRHNSKNWNCSTTRCKNCLEVHRKNDDLFNQPDFNLRHGKHHFHQLIFQQWHGNNE